MTVSAHSLGLFHILPAVFLVLYGFLFAYFFILCERDQYAYERLRREHVAAVQHQRSKLQIQLRKINYSLTRPELAAFYFKNYEKELNCNSTLDFQEELAKRYNWSLRNSLFFVASLISTIGYGESVPRTTVGRLLCFPCAIFGIPLFFYVVSNWGYLFYDGVSAILHFARSKLRRQPKPVSKQYRPAHQMDREGSSGSLDNRAKFWNVGNQQRPTMPHHRRIGESFSIALVVIIFFAWLLLTAIIYTLWETQWDYLSSVYFLFISVTTIGLGDIVPENMHVRMWSFPILLVGFAILAMLLAAAQANVETVYRHMWYLLQVNYQRTLADPPDLAGFEEMNEPLLARNKNKTDISDIVKMLPYGEQFIYHTYVSHGRKEFLGMRWGFLRSRKNQCVQATDPSARRLSWSRPVQFGANERFPRPVKSVNFEESYLHPSDASRDMRKSPSVDATSSISFTTAVSQFTPLLSEQERLGLRTSEGDVSANAPPCCFITEGPYQQAKQPKSYESYY